MGITFRQLEKGNFKIVDVPFIDARIPLYTEYLKFSYGGHLSWGVSKFFLEWNYSAGLHIYPFGKSFSVDAKSHMGSFFLDNITIMGSAGITFEIQVFDNGFLSLGAEYFYRNSRDLFNYISFPKYNNDEAINIDSKGIGFSLGVRF